MVQAVVAAREDEPNDVRIVAYFAARGAVPDLGELRDHLRGTLPAYMLAQNFVALETIPRLPNGKIDRNAFPGPDGVLQRVRGMVRGEPRTDTELLLAGLWRDLVKTPHVSTEDNFFDIGDRSLLAMRAILALEGKIGKRINPRRYIFETLGQIVRA